MIEIFLILNLVVDSYSDCIQEAKNGGSEGGVTVTDEEKQACEDTWGKPE